MSHHRCPMGGHPPCRSNPYHPSLHVPLHGTDSTATSTGCPAIHRAVSSPSLKGNRPPWLTPVLQVPCGSSCPGLAQAEATLGQGAVPSPPANVFLLHVRSVPPTLRSTDLCCCAPRLAGPCQSPSDPSRLFFLNYMIPQEKK